MMAADNERPHKTDTVACDEDLFIDGQRAGDLNFCKFAPLRAQRTDRIVMGLNGHGIEWPWIEWSWD